MRVKSQLRLRITAEVIAVTSLLGAQPASGKRGAWKGKVIGVADGDTFTVLRDKTPVKIRLHGVDAPE